MILLSYLLKKLKREENKVKKLKFYDVKIKKSFISTKYVLKTRKVKGTTRYFAVADAPSKIKAWRIISKSVYMESK